MARNSKSPPRGFGKHYHLTVYILCCWKRVRCPWNRATPYEIRNFGMRNSTVLYQTSYRPNLLQWVVTFRGVLTPRGKTSNVLDSHLAMTLTWPRSLLRLSHDSLHNLKGSSPKERHMFDSRLEKITRILSSHKKKNFIGLSKIALIQENRIGLNVIFYQNEKIFGLS